MGVRRGPAPQDPTSPPHPPGTALTFPMEPQLQQGSSLSPLRVTGHTCPTGLLTEQGKTQAFRT